MILIILEQKRGPMANQAYQFAGGYGVVAIPNGTQLADRNPVSTDIVSPAGNPYQPGQYWQNKLTGTLYVYLGGGNWEAVAGSGITVVTELTGDTGGAVSPSGGNISILGTAAQIATTGSPSGHSITLSLIGPYTPATYTAHGVLIGEGAGPIVATAVGATGTLLSGNTGADPTFTASPSVSGSLTAGTTITATLGNITATAGNFVASAAGDGLVLNSGATSGTTTATLNGRSGQVTITTPSIAAGATFSFALTNSSVTASTTQILYGLTGGTTGSAVTIQSVTNSASTSTIVLQNASAVTANTGSLVLTFLVLN